MQPRSTISGMPTRFFVGTRLRLCLCVMSATLSAHVMATNDTNVAPLTSYLENTPSYDPALTSTASPDGTPSPFFEQRLYGSNDELSDSQAQFFAGIPGNMSVFSLGNTNQEVQVAILIEGTASMRLRESNPQDIDYAIAQFHEYCLAYVRNAWDGSGYDVAALVLSFDWLQIDDTRLDVFFVGIHPGDPQDTLPPCLSSKQSLESNNVGTDVCTRLTLGDFGQDLFSQSQAALVVKVHQNIAALPQFTTYVHNINALQLNRLSISSLFTDSQQITSFLSGRTQSNLFDKSIVPLVADPHLPSATPVVEATEPPDESDSSVY